MLEWRMETAHGWSVKPGAYGKGLKQYIEPELWSDLESTYVGAGLEENWGLIRNSAWWPILRCLCGRRGTLFQNRASSTG
jgi:hypothetical protein